MTKEKPLPGLGYVLSFALAVLVFAIYLPALQNGFVNWDDPKYIYENPAIQRAVDLDFIKWAFLNPVHSNWHPLTVISYAFDFSLWGLEPKGFHLTNIILHAVNTFLVGLLSIKLFTVYGSKAGKAASNLKIFFAAAIPALLFGLHPVHVESVAWVSERKDVLSGFFFLLSVLAYLSYAGKDKGIFYYFASLILFALALMSKPMAITLPLVLLILDFYPLGRLSWKAVAEKIPFFLLSIASAFLTLWAQKAAIIQTELIPLASRVVVALWAPVFYLYKMILPVRLAPYYPHPIKVDLTSIEYVLAIPLLIAITAFALIKLRKTKAYLAAWLFFLVTLLPVLGLVQVGGQAAADRYTYIPSIAPFILLGAGAAYLSDRKGKKAFALLLITATLLAAGLSSLTAKQISVWRDSITMWTHEIETFPKAHIAYNNRALAFQKANDFPRAIEDFSRAIKLAPELSELYNNRGAAYQTMGNFPKAVEDYTMTIKLDPKFKGAYYNRGLSFQKLGNYDSAVRDYSSEMALDPAFIEPYIHRGIIYREAGNPSPALDDFNRAVEIDPKNIFARLNRGLTYLAIGRSEEALSDFKEAIALEPGNPAPYYYSGIISMKLGDNESAAAYLRKASELGIKEADEVLRTLGQEG